jgi:putative Mg2+ transporter-C (MgtC) family protein
MDGWVLLQVAVAALLGGAIGFEREITSQAAGLRTHMLVSLGSVLFTIAGVDFLNADPTRVAAQVVTGIGFLGGGAIIREGATTRGLTTAASLWVTAAIGLAIGLRSWLAACATTVLALLVLWLVKWIEREWLPKRRGMEVTLLLEADTPLDAIEQAARRTLPRSQVLRVRYDSNGQALVLAARPSDGESLPELGEQLRALPGVQGVELTR